MRYIYIFAVGRYTDSRGRCLFANWMSFHLRETIHFDDGDKSGHIIEISPLCRRKFVTNIYLPSLLNTADFGSRNTFTVRITLRPPDRFRRSWSGTGYIHIYVSCPDRTSDGMLPNRSEWKPLPFPIRATESVNGLSSRM